MVTVRNICESLLSHIENNNKTPIKNINDLIQSRKISLEELASIDMYKKELYKTKYENPRNENNMKYSLYLKERQELVNKWNNDKNSQAKLLDILNYKRPVLEEIEDIYTYQNMDLNADKKTTLIIKNEPVKPVKVEKTEEIVPENPLAQPKVTKVKECPEGKILNPVTGRCITDKTKNTTKTTKPAKIEKTEEILPENQIIPSKVIKEKECPEGKILNPITGRCIADKTKKPANVAKPTKVAKAANVENIEEIAQENSLVPSKVIKEKECPEGKILNPITGRCIADKTKKVAKAKK